MLVQTYAPLLAKTGTTILIFFAVGYGISPCRHHINRKPPAIISLIYSGLTLFAIAFGVMLITSDQFLSIVHELTMLTFLAGRVETQELIVVSAIFMSLSFILGNLMRSYYNLHKIEDSRDSGDDFYVFLSGLKGIKRWIEYLLRAFIFLTILGIEYKIHALDSAHALQEFRYTFEELWYIAMWFYGGLLLWDLYLYWCMRNTRWAGSIKTIRMALPVHLWGLGVASFITLAGRHPTLYHFFINIALICSVAGIISLLISLWKDRESNYLWVKGKQLFTAPAPNN